MIEERSIIMHQNYLNEEDEETLFHWALPIYGVSPQSENHNGGILSCNFSNTSSSLDVQTNHFEFCNDKCSSPISSRAINNLFCGSALQVKVANYPLSLKIHISFFKSPIDVHKRIVSSSGTSTQEI